MKHVIATLLTIFAFTPAYADPVTLVQQGKGWVRIPYCGGETRLVCESDSCFVEFSRSSCHLVEMYTASTFYPYQWTVKNLDWRASGNKIPVEIARTSGYERPYFYVFLHTLDNTSYTKLQYQLNQRY